jgi:hypothetical protein
MYLAFYPGSSVGVNQNDPSYLLVRVKVKLHLYGEEGSKICTPKPSSDVPIKLGAVSGYSVSFTQKGQLEGTRPVLTSQQHLPL